MEVDNHLFVVWKMVFQEAVLHFHVSSRESICKLRNSIQDSFWLVQEHPPRSVQTPPLSSPVQTGSSSRSPAEQDQCQSVFGETHRELFTSHSSSSLLRRSRKCRSCPSRSATRLSVSRRRFSWTKTKKSTVRRPATFGEKKASHHSSTNQRKKSCIVLHLHPKGYLIHVYIAFFVSLATPIAGSSSKNAKLLLPW